MDARLVQTDVADGAGIGFTQLNGTGAIFHARVTAMVQDGRELLWFATHPN
jgi:hypothetical protein